MLRNSKTRVITAEGLHEVARMWATEPTVESVASGEATVFRENVRVGSETRVDAEAAILRIETRFPGDLNLRQRRHGCAAGFRRRHHGFRDAEKIDSEIVAELDSKKRERIDELERVELHANGQEDAAEAGWNVVSQRRECGGHVFWLGSFSHGLFDQRELRDFFN